METLTLQKGTPEQPQENEAPCQCAVGDELLYRLGSSAVALAEQDQPPMPVASDETCKPSPAVGEETAEATKAVRYGYREDSLPEVVALLQQAQAGNAEAYGDLYRVHVERVRRYVAARMKDEDRQAIPDVVQDAFCEAFADLPSAHHDVTGWFLVHAAKAYIRYARSVRHQERAVKESKELVRREYAHGYARHHPGVTAIGHVTLVHALARLAPRQREVVQHRYLEGQTQAATAIAMGGTVRAVKSAEYRALVNLRAGLTAPIEQVTA